MLISIALGGSICGLVAGSVIYVLLNQLEK